MDPEQFNAVDGSNRGVKEQFQWNVVGRVRGGWRKGYSGEGRVDRECKGRWWWCWYSAQDPDEFIRAILRFAIARHSITRVEVEPVFRTLEELKQKYWVRITWMAFNNHWFEGRKRFSIRREVGNGARKSPERVWKGIIQKRMIYGQRKQGTMGKRNTENESAYLRWIWKLPCSSLIIRNLAGNLTPTDICRH